MPSIARQTMERDIGQDCLDMLDDMVLRLGSCATKAERAAKRNAQLHLMIDSGLLEKMRVKAENQGISLSEWCRRKLADNSQLERIEAKLDKLLKSK